MCLVALRISTLLSWLDKLDMLDKLANQPAFWQHCIMKLLNFCTLDVVIVECQLVHPCTKCTTKKCASPAGAVWPVDMLQQETSSHWLSHASRHREGKEMKEMKVQSCFLLHHNVPQQGGELM